MVRPLLYSGNYVIFTVPRDGRGQLRNYKQLKEALRSTLTRAKVRVGRPLWVPGYRLLVPSRGSRVPRRVSRLLMARRRRVSLLRNRVRCRILSLSIRCRRLRRRLRKRSRVLRSRVTLALLLKTSFWWKVLSSSTLE